MIARIIEVASWDRTDYPSYLIWEFLLVTLLIMILSYFVIRYSTFLGDKFERLNKLALFLSISIVSTIILPYSGSADKIIVLIAIPSVVLTTLIIPFKLTSWSLTKFRDSYIVGVGRFFFGLPSFFIFGFFVGIAFRDVVGEGGMGAGLVALYGGVLLTIISTIINVSYVIYRGLSR